MRILLTTPILDPKKVWAGSHRVVYDTANFLIEDGYDVVVLTSDMLNTSKKIDQATSVSTLPLSSKIVRTKTLSRLFTRATSLTVSLDTIRFIKQELRSFDLIHGHEYMTFENVVIRYYAKKYAIPYIIQAHGSLIRSDKKFRKRLFDFTLGYPILRDASAVIALTDLEALQYQYVGVPTNLIKVIPNGLDITAYSNLPPKLSFKKLFNITEDEKILLYLGRINESKGLSFLVKSFAFLIKKYNLNNTRLVIAGSDDGYLKKLTTLIDSLDISKYVLTTGLLSEYEKKAAFVDSVVCIYPGQFEPFGLVSIEAAACGLPVIVISGTPMARHVREGRFGLSVPYNDVSALVNSIQYFLNDPECSKTLGINGRNFVYKNFEWKTIIRNLEKIYEKCAQDKK